ncbi:hypothetical protein A2U01_0061048, partial [Trifolium medium]|nr:hypothetical protein [Trifolium medium]
MAIEQVFCEVSAAVSTGTDAA